MKYEPMTKILKACLEASAAGPLSRKTVARLTEGWQDAAGGTWSDKTVQSLLNRGLLKLSDSGKKASFSQDWRQLGFMSAGPEARVTIKTRTVAALYQGLVNMVKVKSAAERERILANLWETFAHRVENSNPTIES